MTYGEFLRAMENGEEVTAFKGTRTMLSLQKLNYSQVVVQLVFIDREDHLDRPYTTMTAVMIWEEAWRAYETFRRDD